MDLLPVEKRGALQVERIRSLKPNVTEAEAVAAFRGGAGGWVRGVVTGDLRSLAAAYVPFRLYEVEIRNRGALQHSLFALDAVNGSLDLYTFDQEPSEAELAGAETRNCLPQCLDHARTVELLESKVRRLVFQSGFFRLRNFRFGASRWLRNLYVPYWLGFFGRGERAHLLVLDAVRRRLEGAKAREMFLDWLQK